MWNDENENDETAENDDQDTEEDAPENTPALSVDGESIDLWDMLGDADELERVQVSFPDAENGYQTEAQEAQPLGWANSAAITLDRKEDSITLSVSVGDPRGAFTLTVRRLTDGTLVMHVPHVNESFQHMPLTLLHEGTYKIGH